MLKENYERNEVELPMKIGLVIIFFFQFGVNGHETRAIGVIRVIYHRHMSKRRNHLAEVPENIYMFFQHILIFFLLFHVVV